MHTLKSLKITCTGEHKLTDGFKNDGQSTRCFLLSKYGGKDPEAYTMQLLFHVSILINQMRDLLL